MSDSAGNDRLLWLQRLCLLPTQQFIPDEVARGMVGVAGAPGIDVSNGNVGIASGGGCNGSQLQPAPDCLILHCAWIYADTPISRVTQCIQQVDSALPEVLYSRKPVFQRDLRDDRVAEASRRESGVLADFPVVQSFRCRPRLGHGTDSVKCLLCLSAGQGQLGIKHWTFGSLLGCKWRFHRGEHARCFLWAVRTQIRTGSAEKIFVTVRAAVLTGQCLVHARGADLIALSRQRVGGIERRRRFASGAETWTASQGECSRGNHGNANN